MEALTLNQCRTLRLHHATQMIKNLNAEVRLTLCLNMSKSILVITNAYRKGLYCTGLPADKARLVKGGRKRSKAAGSGCKRRRLQQPLPCLENKIMLVPASNWDNQVCRRGEKKYDSFI